jgi:hypothetical protein
MNAKDIALLTETYTKVLNEYTLDVPPPKVQAHKLKDDIYVPLGDESQAITGTALKKKGLNPDNYKLLARKGEAVRENPTGGFYLSLTARGPFPLPDWIVE